MPSGSGPAMLFQNPVQVQNGVMVNCNDLTPKHSLIEKEWYNGKGYRYVRFDNGVGNVAPVAGGPAYWMDSSLGRVTSDKTSSEFGAALGDGVAGIFLTSVVTDLGFTWLQTDGTHLAVKLAAADGAGAAGNRIFAPQTDVDGELRSVADAAVTLPQSPATELGRQAAAAVANLAEVYLTIP
jgi:hypothetical protein